MAETAIFMAQLVVRFQALSYAAVPEFRGKRDLGSISFGASVSSG